MLTAAAACPSVACSARSQSLHIDKVQPTCCGLRSVTGLVTREQRTDSSMHVSSSSTSSACSRKSVIAYDKKPNRNPYLELEKDTLPDGKPNTPWRRLQLKIRSTTSLQGLMNLYLSNRQKSAVWRPIHSAGILMRIAALYYYRVILPPNSTDEHTSLSVLQLLNHLVPDLTDPRVLHIIDAARLSQVLVVLAALNPKPTAEVVDPLIREVMREGAKKLPVSKPDLLAELAAALAKLQWKEKEVWLAIATAAKGQLLRNQAQWQDQQEQHALWQLKWQQQQQQQQQQGLWTFQQQQQQPPPSQQTWAEQNDGASQCAFTGAAWGESSYEFHSANSEAEYEVGDGDVLEEDPAYRSDSNLNDANMTTQTQQQRLQDWWPGAAYPDIRNNRPRTTLHQQGEEDNIIWLSMCYPKFAAALASIGSEDAELMQLLGTEAVHVLPLLSLPEVADLTTAYAHLGIAHHELLHAASLQLQQNLAYMRSHSSRSSGRQGRQQRESDVAAVVRAAHALGQLGFADANLIAAVQTGVLSNSATHNTPVLEISSSSTTGSAGSTAAAAIGPEQYVQVLQLLVQSGCLSSSSNSNSSSLSSSAISPVGPLVRWACTGISASGLEGLQPSQLSAAAVALADLQRYPEAEAAADVIGAAAVARAQECGPDVLADALWCCVTLGCANMVMADTAVSAVEQAAETLQQQQQKQKQQPAWTRKRGGRKAGSTVKQAAAAAEGLNLVSSMQHHHPQHPQQVTILSSRHQAQLVLSLQRMGRTDLAQRVMASCQIVASAQL